MSSLSFFAPFALLIALMQVAQANSQYLFRDATVLPMTGQGAIEQADVWVVGERIKQIGSRAELEQAGLGSDIAPIEIESSGLFLMPGLTEMHGHLPPLRAGAEAIREVLLLFLANGVTTVRGMLGHAGHLELRDQIQRGQLLGPTLYLAGPGFSGGNVPTPQAGAERIRIQKNKGWDLAKIYPGLSAAEYEAIAAQARSINFEFSGHIPESVGLLKALAAGQRTIEHLDGYILAAKGRSSKVPDEQWVELARQTRNAGAGVVPTLAVWETLLGIPSPETLEAYPELQFISANQRSSWRNQYTSRYSRRFSQQLKALIGGPDNSIIANNRKRLLGVLHREGVEIFFGTDAPQIYSVPGFANIREMNLMRESGMPILAILHSATAAPGRYFKDKDNFGTVEAGARADLLLLGKDPRKQLDAFARPTGVMVKGHWLTRAQLDEQLDTILARHRQVDSGTQ